MSPRKSSTSSGRPPTRRPRYLGIEAAGEHLPALTPRWWETALRAGLDRAGVSERFRIVRIDGRRAIAEIDHGTAARARSAWNAPLADRTTTLTTRRTWGTLRGAKRWLRDRSSG